MRAFKRLVRALFDGVACFLSFGLNLGLFELVVRFWKRIYWHALKRRFRKVGAKSFIEYPAVISGAQYIEIGENFQTLARLRLEALDRHLGNTYQPEISIGDNVILNYDCHIACVNRIVIGHNVLMASRIFMTDHFHGEITKEALSIPPAQRKAVSRGPVIVEDNVWIGEGAVIMPNVRIGRNSIIGANAVVTKDIPENSVAVGVPARVIRSLVEDLQ